MCGNGDVSCGRNGRCNESGDRSKCEHGRKYKYSNILINDHNVPNDTMGHSWNVLLIKHQLLTQNVIEDTILANFPTKQLAVEFALKQNKKQLYCVEWTQTTPNNNNNNNNKSKL